MIDGSFYLLAAGIGALIGSFLNVCIHRLPRGESIVWPGSHCPSCGTTIAYYDNIPLFSYLWLDGTLPNMPKLHFHAVSGRRGRECCWICDDLWQRSA